MDDVVLEQLFSSEESDGFERKESAADLERIRKTICAFSNDLAGSGGPAYLFVGQNDDATCAGLTVDDELLKRLSEIRSDGLISPMPVLTIDRRTIRGCTVAVIEVFPSDAPPVRYKGRTYVRIGPTTRLASPGDELRLTERRRSRVLPFDLEPIHGASIDDLDLVYFEREYLPSAVDRDDLEQNDRSVEHRLASLRLIQSGSTRIPTLLGMLVAGTTPLDFIPCAYIQFLRIQGQELGDPVVDEHEISGNLQDILLGVDRVMTSHNRVAVDIETGSTEVRRSEYPIVALQQLVRNAVLHRTYEGTNTPVRIYWFDDRIEIHSPGGPFGIVNEANFGNPGVTDYRNPHLAEAMKNLGFVQKFGIGIGTARRELAKNGNPPPEFDVTLSAVMSLVRRAHG